jgi:hypothetical protein
MLARCLYLILLPWRWKSLGRNIGRLLTDYTGEDKTLQNDRCEHRATYSFILSSFSQSFPSFYHSVNIHHFSSPSYLSFPSFHTDISESRDSHSRGIDTWFDFPRNIQTSTGILTEIRLLLNTSQIIVYYQVRQANFLFWTELQYEKKEASLPHPVSSYSPSNWAHR